MDEFHYLGDTTIDLATAANLTGIDAGELERRLGPAGSVEHVTVQGPHRGPWLIWMNLAGRSDTRLVIYEVVSQPAG